MPETWFVDRIEEGVATLVRGSEIRLLPVARLPPGVREGCALVAEDAAPSAAHGERFRLDPAATSRAREDARRRLDDLRRGDAGGDVDL